MDRSKVVEWVQKLMSKAADPAATEAERDACQVKVESLLAKYKIEAMEATTADKIKDHEMMQQDVNCYVPGRSNWGYFLGWAVGPIFDCKVLRLSGWSCKTMQFMGFPEDVKTSVYFFRVLQMQIVEACDVSGYRTIALKNSFAEGMVQRIRERMSATYKKVEEIIPVATTALVLVKKDAVTAYMKKIHPHIKNSVRTHRTDSRAFAAGYKAADNVNIAHNGREKVQGA